MAKSTKKTTKTSPKKNSKATASRKPKKVDAAVSNLSDLAVLARADPLSSPDADEVVKKPPRPAVALPSVWSLSRKSIDVLLHNKKLFGGILAIYGLLTTILVGGLASKNSISQLKTNLHHVVSGHITSIGSSVNAFIKLGANTNNSTSTNSGAGVYQFILILIVSLAIIWALRQVSQQRSVKIRFAYYRGMYPFVPFVVVLMLLGVELLPLALGALLYTTGINNGIVVGNIQKAGFLVAFALLTLLSLYMMSSSIIALYTVTEPDMTPRGAAKAAAHLVRQIRWVVIRKIMFLLAALLVITAIVMVPITLWVTPLAELAYFILSIVAIPIVHSYMFTLYEELKTADD
jgi:hypothetical protein